MAAQCQRVCCCLLLTAAAARRAAPGSAAWRLLLQPLLRQQRYQKDATPAIGPLMRRASCMSFGTAGVAQHSTAQKQLSTRSSVSACSSAHMLRKYAANRGARRTGEIIWLRLWGVACPTIPAPHACCSMRCKVLCCCRATATAAH